MDIKELTRAQWLAEGARLFGADMLAWRFKCPACGHVQTVADFALYKDRGAVPDSAVRSCIGRWYPLKMRGGWSKAHSNPRIKSPCDYHAGGLIGLCQHRVDNIPVFDFAPLDSDIKGLESE